MSKSSEEVLLIVKNVRNKKTDGTLYMMGERMAWMLETKDVFNISYLYADIKGQHIFNATSYVWYFDKIRPSTDLPFIQILPSKLGKILISLLEYRIDFFFILFKFSELPNFCGEKNGFLFVFFFSEYFFGKFPVKFL